MRGEFGLAVLTWMLSSMLAACGGGGDGASGPSATIVLAGDSTQKASLAIIDTVAARVDPADIVNGHLLTRLLVAFKADATVGDVNNAAQVAGATSIASSMAGLPMFTLQVPRQASIADMHALARKVSAQPGVFIAWPERQFKTSKLPDAGGGQSVSPLDLSHLLAARFPAAWNARGAAPADCLPESVTVYVWDEFGDVGSRPSFFSQIDRNSFEFDIGPVLQNFGSPGNSGHGYDVVSTLGAAFDAQKPTGANPFRDCLLIHQIDMFGLGMFDTTAQAIGQLQSEPDARFILNVAMNYPDDLCGPDLDLVCDATTLAATPADRLRFQISLRFILVSAWAHASGIEQRMLVSQAAGNADPASAGLLARTYAGYRDARVSSIVALATHVTQISTLLVDPTLWRSSSNPALPDLTFPATEVASLAAQLTSLGVTKDVGASTTLIVDSGTAAETLGDVEGSLFNMLGADVRAVGENVRLFDVPLVNGTSFATAQVAGLASYLWVLSNDLRNQDVKVTVQQIRQASRTTARSPVVPVVDAYRAVLDLDSVQFVLGVGSGAVRPALLDVNGDGVFDHLDLLQFQTAYGLTDPNRPSIPAAKDYSRFDLNGDGFTGGITTDAFNLDVDGSGATDSLTLDIEGYPVTMNEAALSDLQILCYYAYSSLYAAQGVNRNEALLERTRILGPDVCVGARIGTQMPSQIAGSAPLTAVVERPIGNGQFAPGANLLVELAPTCGTVSPTSARTDAGGAVAATVTPGAGCTSVSVDLVVRGDPGTTQLAHGTVSANVGSGGFVIKGSLVDVPFGQGIVAAIARPIQVQVFKAGFDALGRFISLSGCGDGSEACHANWSATGGTIVDLIPDITATFTSGTAIGKFEIVASSPTAEYPEIRRPLFIGPVGAYSVRSCIFTTSEVNAQCVQSQTSGASIGFFDSLGNGRYELLDNSFLSGLAPVVFTVSAGTLATFQAVIHCNVSSPAGCVTTVVPLANTAVDEVVVAPDSTVTFLVTLFNSNGTLRERRRVTLTRLP